VALLFTALKVNLPTELEYSKECINKNYGSIANDLCASP
jgi:hypothetical protein